MRFILLLSLLMLSCGSQFFELPPPPPDFIECTAGSKHFETGIKGTTLPLPFSGRREIRMYTDKPEFWDEFEGTIHLKKISWNVSWVDSVELILTPFIIASYDGHMWEISSALDLSPFFGTSSDNPDRLQFDIILKAKGFTPAKYFVVNVDAEFYFCGTNHELMYNLD